MSPRRKVDPADVDIFTELAPKPPRRWGLPVVAGLAGIMIAAAITVSTVLLISHEADHRATVKDAEALSYARWFMTVFTSPDPFHANDYTDRVLAQGTGDFAKHYHDNINEIAVSVARSEPTTGAVLEAGVENWNDDGSANVLVATKITTTSPDGKSVIESGNRWVATAIKEGQQWKISQLRQVV